MRMEKQTHSITSQNRAQTLRRYLSILPSTWQNLGTLFIETSCQGSAPGLFHASTSDIIARVGPSWYWPMQGTIKATPKLRAATVSFTVLTWRQRPRPHLEALLRLRLLAARRGGITVCQASHLDITTCSSCSLLQAPVTSCAPAAGAHRDQQRHQ